MKSQFGRVYSAKTGFFFSRKVPPDQQHDGTSSTTEARAVIKKRIYDLSG
jgi:hypothetical protein